MVAEQEADLPSSLVQHQQQVAGLLGDPAAVGVGSHPAEMDPSAVELDGRTAPTAAAARWCRR